jgi:hypothetical protein
VVTPGAGGPAARYGTVVAEIEVMSIDHASDSPG